MNKKNHHLISPNMAVVLLWLFVVCFSQPTAHAQIFTGDADYIVKFGSPIESGLPVIRIDTKDNAPIKDKDNYVNMTFSLTDPDNPKNDIFVTSTTDGIKARGNDSWSNPNALKKSYRIKFDSKISLFGLERAKSWVLIAQYRDPTLLFNAIAFELGNRFALPFNHSFHFVDLYLNGAYKGNYLLTEQNQVNPGRVDIHETEGWLVEIDGYYDEEPKFKTPKYDLPVMIKSPEIEPIQISNPAYDFVRKDINNLCDLMTSANFPENGYRDLINMNTFIDFLMITEIVDNKEIQTPMSTYMYKNKGNVVNMGPLWDFDCGYGYSYNYIHFNGANNRTPMQSFFKRFFDDPLFLVKYKERWNEKYSDIASINDFIDATANRIEKSALENFKTWWYRSISSWWIQNYGKEENDFWQQISNIKNYLHAHISYLNTELNKVEVLPKSKTFPSQPTGYTAVASETFTLVGYGDLTNLSATFQKAALSDFEISDGISKTPAGNGGYLATVSVKPKNSLPSTIYTDVLLLRGSNQGKSFSFELPLSFTAGVLEKAQAPEIIKQPQDITVKLGDKTYLSVQAQVTDGGKLSYLWFNNTTASNSGGRWISGANDPSYTIPTGAIGTYYYYVMIANENNLATVEKTVSVVSNAVTVRVSQTTDYEMLSENPLKAWVHNGLLHITGLTVGEILSVYTVSGALVYRNKAISDEVVIPLTVQGVYIAYSENNTIKVVFQ